MTGGGSRLLTAQSKILPGLSGKAAAEGARQQKRVEDETKRVRRKIGFTTQKPQLLEPVKPDPVPTFVESGQFGKPKPKGRKANILAGGMNRRRQILSTQTGGTILQ